MKKLSFNSLRFVKNLYKKLLPLAIRISESISPRLAAGMAYGYWRRTFRHHPSAKERTVLEQARIDNISARNGHIPLYTWGEGKSKALVVGGWNGRPSQFHTLIKALNQGGFQVVGIDPPGHGRAKGNSSSLLEIADAITSVTHHLGPFDLYIGHSAGAMAGVAANAQGAAFGKMALIAMPNSSQWLLESYCAHLGLKRYTCQLMRAQFERRHGKNAFEKTSPLLLGHSIRIPILLIHDSNDKLVPLRHSIDMKNACSLAQLHETKGLGHFRIINAAKTVKEICEFASIKTRQEDDINRVKDD